MNHSIYRVENLKIIQKRKAIKEALEPFMDSQLLANTLSLWEEKYSHMPTFALQHFLREICENKTLLPLRSKMLQALIRSLSALPDDVLDSSKKNAQHKEDRADKKVALYIKKEKGHPPEVRMFIDLVEELIAFPGREYPAKIRLYVLENLGSTVTDTSIRWVLHSWINQIEPLREINLDITSMQQVINLVYVALCEYLGPVKADAALKAVLVFVQKNHPTMSVNKLL